MDDELRQRLETVERAVTDGETDLSDLADGAATAERVADLETDLSALEERLEEVEASTQALRGYVGEVRSVNREVEETAERALAEVEKLARDGAAGGVDSEPTESRSGNTAPTSRQHPSGNQESDLAADAHEAAGRDRSVDGRSGTQHGRESNGHESAAGGRGTPRGGTEPEHTCPECGRPGGDAGAGTAGANEPRTDATDRGGSAGRDLGLGGGFADRSVDAALRHGDSPRGSGRTGSAAGPTRSNDDGGDAGVLQTVRELL